MIEYIVDNNTHIENKYNSNRIKITSIILLIPFLLFTFYNMGFKSTFINLVVTLLISFIGKYLYSLIVNNKKLDLFDIVINSIIISIILPKGVSVVLLILSIIIALIIEELLIYKLDFNCISLSILCVSILILLMMILGKDIIYIESTIYMSIVCLIIIFVQFVMQNIKLPILIVFILTYLLINYINIGLNNLDISLLIDKALISNLLFFGIIASSFNGPVTPVGQILYGLFLGIVTCLISYFVNPYYSCIFGILLISIFTYLLDIVGGISRFEFNKSIWLFMIAWILIIITGLICKG